MAGKNETLHIKLITEKKEKIRKVSQSLGESMTSFSIAAIDEKINSILLNKEDNLQKKLFDEIHKLGSEIRQIKILLKN